MVWLVSLNMYYSVYLWSKRVCFVLSHWNLPNHNASWCVLGIFEKLLMSRCTNFGLRLVGAMVWKLLMIESFFQSKWNKIEIEKNIGIWVCTWCVRFNRVYFTIFRVQAWMILIFEKKLLLEIQTNCKYWVWKEKSVEPSMCSHCWSFQF